MANLLVRVGTGLPAGESGSSNERTTTRRTHGRAARFLTVERAAQELALGVNMVRGLLRTGELRGMQIGGRHVWRIDRQDVEDFIGGAYRRTREQVESGALPEDDEDAGAD